MTDEEKLKKAREGDFSSIEEICAATWETLYRFIYFKVQNREEAEDITQETYVKALSYFRKKDDKIDKYIGFLKTVSLNVLRDRWRKKKRQGINIDLDQVSPKEAALEDGTELSAQRDLIKNALNKLSEEQRRVVELRIIKGYSAAETARLLNKKEGAVRVVQYRALQALAQILRNEDYPGGIEIEQ